MKVTVKDCLTLDVFRNAEVLAGRAELDNEVRSISVLDAADAAELEAAGTKKDQILLTSFAGIRGDAGIQSQILQQAAKQGCAAVAICRRGQMQGIPEESVVRAAEEADLPLLLMADGTDYSETISAVMDRVLYGDNFRNSLISNTIFHLLNFEKYSNFQSALKEAAINNDFQLILLSEDFNPVLTIETRHQATIQDAIRLGRERNVEEDSRV